VRILRELQKTFTEPDRTLHFVGHQANLRMLETVCLQCGFDEDRHHHNVVNFGNTGAAGAPGVISMNWDRWTDRDDIAVVGVGSGLSWSGHVLRFGEAP
jgi:3-oxoacyl-[acyl-carrier-protein] synthase-3